MRCLLGWHPWEFRDETDEFTVDGVVWLAYTTLSRCSNPSCFAHDDWSVVNVDYKAVAAPLEKLVRAYQSW